MSSDRNQGFTESSAISSAGRLGMIVALAVVISVSIGNLINYRSVTIYKAVSLFLPFITIYILLREKRKPAWNLYFTFFTLFIAANFCMFGVLKNPHSLSQKLFFIGRLAGHGAVMYLFYNLVRGAEEGRLNKLFAMIIYASSSVNAAVNGLQLLNDRLLPGYLRIPHEFYILRGDGLFLDPNYNGFFVCICVFLLLHLYLNRAVSRRWFWVFLVLNLIILFLSLSIGAFIGLILGAVVLLFLRIERRGRIIIAVGLIVLIAVGVHFVFLVKGYDFSGKDITLFKYRIIYYLQTKLSSGSGGSRIDHFRVAWHAFLKNPIFGIGTTGFLNANNYLTYAEAIDLHYDNPRGWIIHSNLFAVLGENGLAGFIPYLALVFLGLFYSWKLYRKKAVYAGLFGMQIASFVVSNTINNLYFNFYWLVQSLPFIFYTLDCHLQTGHRINPFNDKTT